MESSRHRYVKRTQKDYSMPFKLSVVREAETTDISIRALARKYGIQSPSTVRHWLEKFGTFDRPNQATRMENSKDQKLLELQTRLRQLEQRNARLERELEEKEHKAAFFDLMIDLAEKEYKIDIRKNSSPGQSESTGR